ncbi:MAG: Mur ligase family protein [Methanobacteriaceae archaeon]|nr:Mur ligase family protein [Methanobacteriaceae archaeon]
MTNTLFSITKNSNKIASQKTFSIAELAEAIGGKIYGWNDFYSKNGFNGIFETLNEAVSGDIVIRHWINGKGVEIASEKDIACLITLNPTEDALKKAEEIAFPVIVVKKIQFATAFALKWTIENLAPNSKRVVISGTNGKSTTSHMIHHILKNSGYDVFTNTDAESEFNTLIDPMVAKMIAEQVIEAQEIDVRALEYVADIPNKSVFDYIVVEVSEVQGWGEELMENHALIMSSALNPNVGVVTNVAMDHIGLVNSLDEVYDETSGIVKAINKDAIVLNYDDKRVLKMLEFINGDVDSFFNSMDEEAISNYDVNLNNKVFFSKSKNAIIVKGKSILDFKQLPFNSEHFIRNILSSISACLALNISIEEIVEGVKNYKPLNRRFIKLSDEPIIIDDFAHNPDGVKATIRASSTLANDLDKKELYVVFGIRGSRGEELNGLISQAIAEVINELNAENDRKINLFLSSSIDYVNELNTVKDFEKAIFTSTLDKNAVEYTHYDNLVDVLKDVYNLASKDDVILLIGAQGMDPAENVLTDLGYI